MYQYWKSWLMKLQLQEEKKRFYQKKLSDLDPLFFFLKIKGWKENRKANHASPVMCLSWWQQLVIKKKIYVWETNLMFDFTISSNLFDIIHLKIDKLINFVYSTELEKYVFRLVKCVERRRNSKFPCRKVLEKKVHLNNHGWTQKQVNKAGKASILLIKCWRQLQVKRMKKG